MLLNILQCTGQAPQQRVIQSNVKVLRVKNPLNPWHYEATSLLLFRYVALGYHHVISSCLGQFFSVDRAAAKD